MSQSEILSQVCFNLIKVMISLRQEAFEVQLGPIKEGETDHGVWRVKVERVED